MPIAPADILRRVQTSLQDQEAGGVRWKVSELVDHLNDGLVDITTLHAAAYPVTRVLALTAGARQRLPADATKMVRPVRNVSGTVPNHFPGQIVTAVSSSLIDAMIPGWQGSGRVRPDPVVEHVIPDSGDPLAYEVYPPNDGTGQIEVVIGAVPPAVAPLPSNANANDIDSYPTAIPLSQVYRGALVDYVLFRAYAKDAAGAGMPERAAAHRELFNQAVLARAAAEAS